jgi:hypothetical protein
VLHIELNSSLHAFNSTMTILPPLHGPKTKQTHLHIFLQRPQSGRSLLLGVEAALANCTHERIAMHLKSLKE